jgi:hypothetical protein
MTSVMSEALLSNFQEKILKNFGSPQNEMVRGDAFSQCVRFLMQYYGTTGVLLQFCRFRPNTGGHMPVRRTPLGVGVLFTQQGHTGPHNHILPFPFSFALLSTALLCSPLPSS